MKSFVKTYKEWSEFMDVHTLCLPGSLRKLNSGIESFLRRPGDRQKLDIPPFSAVTMLNGSQTTLSSPDSSMNEGLGAELRVA